jgi:hypothetical protein
MINGTLRRPELTRTAGMSFTVELRPKEQVGLFVAGSKLLGLIDEATGRIGSARRLWPKSRR